MELNKVEKYLRECVDSVLAQTYSNFEIIVVDSVLEDEKRIAFYKRMEEMRKNFNVVINQSAKNIAALRNYGASFAEGDYILFLDCDDWLYNENSLKEIYKEIVRTNADLIRLSYVAFKNNKQAKIRLREKTLEELAKTVFVAPWTKCIKREKIVKFPENTLLEDVVQHIQQIDNINTIAICKTPYAVWNRDNENAISSDKAKYNENSKRYSSVYRNYADLIDLQLKNKYCIEEKEKRIKFYKDIILQDKVLDLINGGESQ